MRVPLRHLALLAFAVLTGCTQTRSTLAPVADPHEWIYGSWAGDVVGGYGPPGANAPTTVTFFPGIDSCSFHTVSSDWPAHYSIDASGDSVLVVADSLGLNFAGSVTVLPILFWSAAREGARLHGSYHVLPTDWNGQIDVVKQ